jgi:cell division protein FtsB
MQNKKNQGLNKREKRAITRIALFLFLVSLLILAFAPGRSLYSQYKVKKEIEAQTAHNRIIEQRNRELSKEIKRLKTDDAYLEQLARKKHGMLRKNEEVYYLKKPEKAKKRQN